MCVCVCIGFSRFFSILSLNYLVENEIREELNRVTMIESNIKLVDVLFFFSCSFALYLAKEIFREFSRDFSRVERRNKFRKLNFVRVKWRLSDIFFEI